MLPDYNTPKLAARRIAIARAVLERLTTDTLRPQPPAPPPHYLLVTCGYDLQAVAGTPRFDFKALSDVFGPGQLVMIAAAFGDEFETPADVFVSTTCRARAAEFGRRYVDRRERIAAIMENLIANGGKFDPASAGT